MSVVLLISMACGAATLAATATPVPPVATNTPLPTKTPPAATKTSLPPTETEIPATPTPAPVGVAVKSDSYEVTVIDAVKRDRIYPGGKFLFTPLHGYMLVDIGVKVRNLTGSPASLSWGDVYVVDSNGDGWAPNWGTYQEVSAGKKFDPLTLGLSEKETDPAGKITFNNDIYLRLIYHVLNNAPTTLLFGFGDSPLIEIVIK